MPPLQLQEPAVYPEGPLSASGYATPGKTALNTPASPALLKLRPLFGSAAVALRFHWPAVAVPPLSFVTVLTSLRRGLRVFVIVHTPVWPFCNDTEEPLVAVPSLTEQEIVES